MKLVVYVARHGETDWNVAGRMQGHTDVPLNEVGRDQARDLADRLAGKKIRAIGSSDLVRARETAEIVGLGLGLDVSHVARGLRERRYGVFEGLTRDEMAERFPAEYEAWRRDPRTTPPGAESPDEVARRIVRAVRRATEKLARPGEPALLVTHGGSLKSLILGVHGGRALVSIPNGAIYRFEYDGERFTRAPEGT